MLPIFYGSKIFIKIILTKDERQITELEGISTLLLSLKFSLLKKAMSCVTKLSLYLRVLG